MRVFHSLFGVQSMESANETDKKYRDVAVGCLVGFKGPGALAQSGLLRIEHYNGDPRDRSGGYDSNRSLNRARE